MVLLQIQEPDTPQVKTAQYRLALGIDLGTTNSLAASLNQAGDAAVLSDTKGRQLIPSVVHYAADGEACVGRKAQEFAMQDPANTITSIKRIMGKSLKEIEAWRSHYPYNFSEVEQQVPRLKIYGRQISAVEVSAQILQHLVGVAENSLGEKSAGAVITVPAYFDDAQRQATKDAARLAGINLLRLLNEPTAAAVAYGLDQQAEGVHAIYDLGGGTFDISILRLNRGVFEVLSTRGDTALGGDDFDQKIVNWITEQMGFGQECSQIFSCRLRAIAKDAREQLTTKDAVELDVQCSCGERWQGVLTREIFYQLADPLIDRTLKTCRRAMLDAGIDNEDICDVVMVGGATRMPRVRERVSQFFAREVLVSIDPDRVVAIGAALQADQLIGNRRGQQLLLLDVLPLSLGLETMGGLVEKIIPRNTSIPATRSQEFTTFKDGQSAMAIHVVQGERELVADNRSLARFELRNIPPMVAGAARIQVTFQVDADGILSVTAREAGTGVESHIEVKATYGLSENEIQAMLKASYEHARADIDLRRLREQQIEVDRVLEALKTALNKDGELLSEAERGQVDQAVAHLQKVRQESEDVKQLRDALSLLEQATQEFVLRRMNSAVAQVVTGKSIDTYDQDAAQATGHTTDQVIQEQENRKG